MTFEKHLKYFLTGNEQARFVFINNIEVEEYWSAARNTLKLPQFASESSQAIVNRMEEFGLFLAGAHDYLVLKAPVEAGYVSYLQREGFALPQTLTVETNQPQLNITQNILACPATVEKLRRLAVAGNTYLMPFGVSHLEEELSRQTGLPLAVPSRETFERVNSKIYSRQLNQALGLPLIPGVACESIGALRAGFEGLKSYLAEGTKLVLKDAFGVSGKGLAVLDSERKFAQLLMLLERSHKKSPERPLGFVIEKWVAKAFDFNYQFVIAKSGEVRFSFVKEAITENGVHLGHRMPARLDAAQVETLREASQKIGKALFADGFYGVVGVDGIAAADGTIYPLLEINARFNMSTYQSKLQEELLNERSVAIAKHYPLKLTGFLSFTEVQNALGDLLFQRHLGRGFLINNFATVNAGISNPGTPFRGRLYGLLIGQSSEELRDFDEKISTRLAALEVKDAHEQAV